MGFWTGLLAKMFGNEAKGGMSILRQEKRAKAAERKKVQAAIAPKPKTLKAKLSKAERAAARLEKQNAPFSCDKPKIRRKGGWRSRDALRRSMGRT